MSELEQQGSIYKEMAARRSRSEELNALAVSQGLEVHVERVPTSDSSDEEIDPAPAFSMEEIEKKPPEEPAVESIEEQSGEVASELDSEAFEEVPEPSDPEPVDTLEEDSRSAEDLIAESEDLLADEPYFEEQEDVKRVAEDLVDQIGQVVDIQRLPKSQPSRVMSKVKPDKPAQAEEPAAESTAPEQSAEEVESPEPALPPSDAGNDSPKKKKKKISLLDSYFKGL